MSNDPSTPAVGHASAAANERQILGHPIGLFVLFFTELWERFNFYGMRALLIFYLTDRALGFGFEDDFAQSSFGATNGLLYAATLIGGMCADRILGYRRSIVIGGLLMALGEFVLSAAGFGLIPRNNLSLYGALGLIIAGNGFFKPNISTMVGTLYKQGDPRRDGAFTIFYMGINIGAFFAPLVCGAIGQTYGYHWGFGIAGVGMLVGLVVFLAYGQHLGERGKPPAGAQTATTSGLLFVGVLIAIPIAGWLVSKPHFVEAFATPIFGGLFLAYILWEAFRSNIEERHGIFVAVALSMASVAFWASFEQAGSSMNLFTDRHINRVVFGYEIPASAFQATNALFIVLLGPLFSMLWLHLAKTGRNPSSPMKFGLGLIQVGLGFIAMVIAARHAQGGARAGLMLLMIAYLLHTTGELCISPVGLSMITKMAPNRLAGLLMGLWFLAPGIGHVVAGNLAARSKAWGFEKLYTFITAFAVGAGILTLVFTPIIRRWEQNRLESHGRSTPTR